MNSFENCGYCTTMADLHLPGHGTEVRMEMRHMWCITGDWSVYVMNALAREPHNWKSVYGMRNWIHTMHANYHKRSSTTCLFYDRLLVTQAMVWAGTPRSVWQPLVERMEEGSGYYEH